MEETSATTTSRLDDDSLIASPDARRQMLGGISISTEYRWERDLPDFPRPVRINGRKFYRVGDLRRFTRERAAA